MRICSLLFVGLSLVSGIFGFLTCDDVKTYTREISPFCAADYCECLNLKYENVTNGCQMGPVGRVVFEEQNDNCTANLKNCLNFKESNTSNSLADYMVCRALSCKLLKNLSKNDLCLKQANPTPSFSGSIGSFGIVHVLMAVLVSALLF